MNIRLATQADASSILDIYAPYVKETAVTFDVTVPTRFDFIRRMEEIRERFPYLVAEQDERITGYAYAHSERDRAAYQWNAELSIYIHKDFQGHGLGSRIYSTLIDLLGILGYRNLYAAITLPNEASLFMHQRLGFRELAVHKNAGYKLGKWHDVAWLDKKLGPYTAEPTPPLPMSELAPEKLRSVLEDA